MYIACYNCQKQMEHATAKQGDRIIVLAIKMVFYYFCSLKCIEKAIPKLKKSLKILLKEEKDFQNRSIIE